MKILFMLIIVAGLTSACGEAESTCYRIARITHTPPDSPRPGYWSDSHDSKLYYNLDSALNASLKLKCTDGKGDLISLTYVENVDKPYYLATYNCTSQSSCIIDHNQ